MSRVCCSWESWANGQLHETRPTCTHPQNLRIWNRAILMFAKKGDIVRHAISEICNRGSTTMAPVTYLVCVAAMVAMARYDNARHDEHAFLSQVDTLNNVARSHHATQGVHTTSNILMMQTFPLLLGGDPLACVHPPFHVRDGACVTQRWRASADHRHGHVDRLRRRGGHVHRTRHDGPWGSGADRGRPQHRCVVLVWHIRCAVSSKCEPAAPTVGVGVWF